MTIGAPQSDRNASTKSQDATSYTTIQGDTFDQIAKKAYDDERRMDILLEANPAYAGTIVFPAGIMLILPTQRTTSTPAGFPPWRKQT